MNEKNKSTPRPPRVEIDGTGERPTIAGWPELEAWSQANDPVWARTKAEAERHGLEPEDATRFLLARYVVICAGVKEEFMTHVRGVGAHGAQRLVLPKPEQPAALKELSPSAKLAVSWFWSPAADGLTSREFKEYIAATWGKEITEELVAFFKKEDA